MPIIGHTSSTPCSGSHSELRAARRPRVKLIQGLTDTRRALAMFAMLLAPLISEGADPDPKQKGSMYDELRRQFGEAPLPKRPVWWRCEDGIQHKTALHGRVSREPNLMARLPPVPVVEAGKGRHQFGETYYLIATPNPGKQLRYACHLTASGDIWRLEDLD